MPTTIKPTGDRIVAVRVEAVTQTKSGIHLPEASKHRPAIADVTAVGPDAHIMVGDRIAYKEYATFDLSLEGKEYLIINEEDVLATLGEK